MAEITLERVTKRFADGTEAVRDVSLEIADGEFFILVGPSGCGKSTLLNMIVGLEDISAGEIRVDGRRVNELDPKDRNMAMVFQSYAIYPHMTVYENLAFPLKLAKLPRRQIDERVRRAAGMLELDGLLDRKPRSLSGGQRQRVAMGRAMVREPAAFLLDEPLSNLDARLRVQMRAEIARLQRRLGTTTVYVTHDQTEAMTLGERIAVLRRGRLQQVGTPRELYEAPRNLFVAGFIGSPGMNFLPAERLDAERLKLPVGEVVLPREKLARLPGDRSSFFAGVRPEDLQDARSGAGARPADLTFSVRVEMVEWLGAELYVHFETAGATALAELPADIELDAGREGRLRLVARLDKASAAAAGAEITLRLDPAKLLLFDPGSGERLL